MGELCSKSGGYYLLKAKIGTTTVKKAFKNSDLSLEEVEVKPKTNDFYLHIEDLPINDKSKNDK